MTIQKLRIIVLPSAKQNENCIYLEVMITFKY